MKICSRFLTIGKTDRRNDDFGIAVSLFGYQTIGIIGDFTSDSPQGAGAECVRHLQEFVSGRIATWREMLLPSERLLPLIARHTNDWLRDYGQKVQTTLIVFNWDLNKEICYFISVGDSGLAVAGPNGLRFLREGDRQGLRVSAGFLPGNFDATVFQAPVRSDETLFAFTDGFWEDTTSFMNEQLLQDVFQGPEMAVIEEKVHRLILQPANRKDDLSILIFKGETMETSNKDTSLVGPSDMAQLVREELSRQLDLAVGEGQLGAQASPLEKDIVRLFGDAPQLESRFLASLQPQISANLENRLAELFAAQQKEVGARLEALEKKVARQLDSQQKAIAVLNKKLSEQPTTPTARPQTEARSVSAPVSRSSNQADTKPNMLAGKRPLPIGEKIKDVLNNQVFLFSAIVVSVVLVGLLIFYLWGNKAPVVDSSYSILRNEATAFYQAGDLARATDQLSRAIAANPKASADDVQILKGWKKEMASQKQAPAKVKKPPVPVTTPASVSAYQPAPISAGMLAALGTDQARYQSQTAEIQAKLDALPTLTLPVTEIITLENNPDFNAGAISVGLSQNSTWVNLKPVAREYVSKVWLQTALQVDVDGLPGDGTRSAFLTAFGERVKRANLVASLLPTGSEAELDKTIRNLAGSYPKDTYESELLIISDFLLKQGPGKDSLNITIPKPNTTHAVTVLLKQAGKITEVGLWLSTATKASMEFEDLGRSIRVIWLAHHLRFPRTDGATTTDFLKQVAPYAGKDAETLYSETLVAWSKR